MPVSNNTGPVTLTLDDPLICYSGRWLKASDYRDPSRFPYDTEILLYVRSGTVNSPDRISVTKFKVMNSPDPYGTAIALGEDHAMLPVIPKLDIADDKEAKLASGSVMDFTNGYNAKGYIDIVKNIYGMDMINFDSDDSYFEVAKVDTEALYTAETTVYKEKLKGLE